MRVDRKIDYIVAGDDHVDLRLTLEELNARYGVRIVRVDSGGTLNGVLLRAGLVDEVSALINPTHANCRKEKNGRSIHHSPSY
jgi:2,5-diamino-6-(ribosylamino)-4(3H)-pyrimidinone 5'-phosphate reductase